MRSLRAALALAVLMTWQVLCPSAPAQAESVVTNDVMLLMDTSGSMRDEDGAGQVKIEGAKAGVISLINSLPSSVRLGLMTFPGDGNCGDPRLHHPVQRMDAGTFSRAVSALPDPAGNTPTGTALRRAAASMHSDPVSDTIVLVSDGLSNCGDPPCEVAEEIAATGVALTVNTIGFQVDERGQRELDCIAAATGGASVTVDDSDELGDEMARQMEVQLRLEVTFPSAVSASTTSTPVTAVVSNGSGLTATDVQVALAPKGEVRLGILRPVVQLGNLAKGEQRTIRWAAQVSPLLAGETVSVRVTARARNAAQVARDGSISFAKLGGDLVSAQSAFAGFTQVAVLGDSFSSGDGAFASHADYADYQDDRKRADCRRSRRTYADVLFGADRVTNMACSGAVAANLASRDDLSGTPQVGDLTQLQQLDYRLGKGERFDAVFVTVGGNDVGFVDVVKGCTRDMAIAGACPVAPRSGNHGTANDTVAAVGTIAQYAYRRIAQAFALHGVDVPPIVVSAYPMMTPAHAQLSGVCTWEGPVQNVALSKETLAEFAVFQRRVNTTLQQAAEKARASGVPVYFAAATEWAVQPDHTACSKDPWINPVTRDRMRSDGDESRDWSTALHPTIAGHQAWVPQMSCGSREQIACLARGNARGGGDTACH